MLFCFGDWEFDVLALCRLFDSSIPSLLFGRMGAAVIWMLLLIML